MDNYHQQPNYNQPPPPPPPFPHYQQQQMAPVISIKEWMLIMLVMIIPIVNIIMMFVWAFSEGNPTKQNYFKASLLWFAIVIGIYILFIVLFLGLIASLGY